jgi:hypothetical protein
MEIYFTENFKIGITNNGYIVEYEPLNNHLPVMKCFNHKEELIGFINKILEDRQ